MDCLALAKSNMLAPLKGLDKLLRSGSSAIFFVKLCTIITVFSLSSSETNPRMTQCYLWYLHQMLRIMYYMRERSSSLKFATGTLTARHSLCATALYFLLCFQATWQNSLSLYTKPYSRHTLISILPFQVCPSFPLSPGCQVKPNMDWHRDSFRNVSACCI